MKDLVGGATAIAFGIAVALASWSLGVGTPSSPGAGFFPLVASSLIAGLGALLLLAGVLELKRARSGAGDGAGSAPFAWRPAACLAALFVYAQCMEWVGFGTATIVLMIFLFRAARIASWRSAVAMGAASALAAKLAFGTLLGMNLPPGVTGF